MVVPANSKSAIIQQNRPVRRLNRSQSINNTTRRQRTTEHPQNHEERHRTADRPPTRESRVARSLALRRQRRSQALSYTQGRQNARGTANVRMQRKTQKPRPVG